MSRCASACELGPAIDGERRLWRPEGRGLGQVCLYAAERRHGRPLLLVHDLEVTSSAYEMRPLFESFRWRRPTYALDFPGFGLSERCDLAYTPALFGFVLAELLRKLRRPDLAVDVVALGRGSEIAARVARDHPSLVRSLAMLEPVGILPSRRRRLDTFAARVVLVMGDAAARAFYALLAAGPVVRRALGSRFCGAPDPGLLAYAAACARAAGAHRAPLAALARASTPAQAEMLHRCVAVPVLVVHDVRMGDAVELESFLRGRANRFAARVSPTRGMPQFDRRGETVAALDKFWQSLPKAAREQAWR